MNAGVPFDAQSVWNALTKRIEQGIYMGSGLLLPHARIQGLKFPLMAFAVAPEIQGVRIPSKDTAQFMCLLLSPLESATAHTVAIAAVAKLLLDPAWKAQALACESSDSLKELFPSP